MSVNYNRLLGDWRSLKATLLVTAEKIFGEPEARGPLVLVHDEIRKQPCHLAPSSSQAFSWGQDYILFSRGILVIVLLNNLHILNITEYLLFCIYLHNFQISFLLLSTFHAYGIVITSISYLPILRLCVELKDQYLTSLGSVALYINTYQINPRPPQLQLYGEDLYKKERSQGRGRFKKLTLLQN